MDIVIELPADESTALSDLPDATVLAPKNFGGGADVVQVLVPLVTAALPIIANVIVERIRAKKRIRIFVNGEAQPTFQFEGVSEKVAAQMVTDHLNRLVTGDTGAKSEGAS